MASAALSEPDPQSAQLAPDVYARAVWSKLAAGALAAALVALVEATLPPFRANILIESGAAAIGLTLFGVALAVSPVLIWIAARMLARGPNLLNPLWYWLFVIAAGASASTLALLFLRASVVSVFGLAALGFSATSLVHRLWRPAPSWISALMFLAAGLTGEFAINAVTKGTWPFIALDLSALAIFALMIVTRAGGFARIRAMLKRPHPKAGVTYAAMHLIGLAEAPASRAAAESPEQGAPS
jgi:FtsH-binding integral membrane protein